MTDQHHPITPPPELIRQWQEQAPRYLDGVTARSREEWLIERASQWGSDQELEACCRAIEFCAWFVDPTFRLAELRAARRPKQQSLKQQALRAAHIEVDPEGKNGSLIIRALEALPDD